MFYFLYWWRVGKENDSNLKYITNLEKIQDVKYCIIYKSIKITWFILDKIISSLNNKFKTYWKIKYDHIEKLFKLYNIIKE